MATSVSDQYLGECLRKARVVPSASMVLLDRFPKTVETIVLAAFEVVSWSRRTA